LSFESKGLKPVFHVKVQRLKACAFQATSMGKLDSTCTAPTTVPMTAVMTHLATFAVWRPICLNL
jgi:hypothetical protein